jgi:hypothetical protein
MPFSARPPKKRAYSGGAVCTQARADMAQSTSKREISAMKLPGMIILVALLACVPSAAQQTAKFAKVDCAASKLVMPPTLICLASNEVAGTSFDGGSPSGVFKYWNAIGKVGGNKVYLYAVEAVDASSAIRFSKALSDTINIITPYPKPATDFSDLKKIADADYVAFKSGDGDSCVAIRKVGSARATGYRWVLFGLLCVPSGKTLADVEISSFVSSVGFR